MPVTIRLLSTTAMKTTLDALAGDIAAAGYSLDGSFAPSAQIARRVADGETADAAIVTAPALEELSTIGKMDAGGRIDIARSAIAVGVKSGQPHPDISTPKKFRAAMLAARHVAMSNPVGGGQSGAATQRAFEKLGIWEQMRGKLTFGPGGPAGLIGFYLVRGEADIGIQQNAELMAVPGVDVVGLVPGELQSITTFSIGAMAGSRHPEAARAIGEVLRSPSGRAAIERMGLEPA